MDRPKSPFMESVRAAMRFGGLSYRSEQSYLDWIRRYIHFHRLRHPKETAEPEATAFFTHLTANRNLALSTKNQAICALVFLYRFVIQRPLEGINASRATKARRIPVVLAVDEVHALLTKLNGSQRLAASLMYGSGLRLMECLRFRVHDVDFSHRAIVVWNGKGGKHCVTTLADSLILPLERQLAISERFLDENSEAGGVSTERA